VGDKLVFRHEGRLHEYSHAAELFAKPATPELAGFIGALAG
jgi:polar amino acid transport system ATP-binding protein